MNLFFVIGPNCDTPIKVLVVNRSRTKAAHLMKNDSYFGMYVPRIYTDYSHRSDYLPMMDSRKSTEDDIEMDEEVVATND